MSNLKQSYLLKEAARISNELIAEKGVTAPTSLNNDWPKVTLAKAVTGDTKDDGSRSQAGNITPASGKVQSPVIYREKQLENLLMIMCKRCGFNGAVVADNNGLPVASYNSPVKNEIIAAFTSILGMALAGAVKLLDKEAANYICLDINHTEKAALRLFHIDDEPYFLIIICPQEIDEKAAVELSIDQIVTILK